MGGALDVPGNTSPVAECMRRFSSLPNYIRTPGINMNVFYMQSIISPTHLP